jgi:hypothetical protein
MRASGRSALGGQTDSEVKLTAWGVLLQGVLRLTGPVLLALALLALRGRVKRCGGLEARFR